MEDEDVMNTRLAIKESLKKLDEYASYLRSRITDVKSTQEGVKNSICSARTAVEENFKHIRNEMVHMLECRQKAILNTISEIERKDLDPLSNVEGKINRELSKTAELIEKGNASLDEDDATLLSEGKNLKNELQVLPIRYPDTPCVSQTLTVKFSENNTQSVIDAVSSLGELSMTGSLQIADLIEQPGAILVQWYDETYSDSESITDYSMIQEYMLQCCRTDNKGNDDSVFSTVYSGEESSHLVTDLEPHVSYTFRVCGRYGSEAKWGSWSIPRNGITTLDQHEWSAEDCFNQNKLAVYQLSNRRKTATKVFPDCSKVLRSRTMSYRLDTALVFKIDETGDSSNGDGIGLTTALFDFSNAKQVLQCPGSVSLNSKGVVYVNGTPMTTRLPQLKRASVVVFEASRVSEDKLRVSITMNDKLVTFDWQVDSDNDGFYFAMGFQHSGWQVSV
ncbi:cytokine receptor-like factor 3 [Montipora capricornis]|uniref:cytokine receptor-like factor 3 n=1 Tax=Montipora capricornis TaxID=246305 RepID=UPI0035F21701